MNDDYDFDGRESGTGTIIGVLILSAILVASTVGLMWYLQGPFVGRKMLVTLVAPVGLMWLLFFVIAMTATFTKQKFLAALGWLSLVALSTFGNDSFASGLMESLEKGNPRYQFAEGESFDYGFVLGGGMEFKKSGEIDFNAANERIFEAVELYRNGHIKKLAFTGSPFLWKQDQQHFDATSGEPKKDSKDQNAEQSSEEEKKQKNMEDLNQKTIEEGLDLGYRFSRHVRTVAYRTQEKEDLPPIAESEDKMELEVLDKNEDSKQDNAEKPASDQNKDLPKKQDSDSAAQKPEKQDRFETKNDEEIWTAKLISLGVKKEDIIFLSGRNTFEEMFRIDEFLKDKPDATSALITSAWHMNRASKLGRQQALKLTSVPVDFRTGPKQTNPIFFLPNSEAFQESSSALKEIVAAWF